MAPVAQQHTVVRIDQHWSVELACKAGQPAPLPLRSEIRTRHRDFGPVKEGDS